MVREGIIKGRHREVVGIKVVVVVVVVVVTRAVGEVGMVVVEGIRAAEGGEMITIGLGVMAVEEVTVGVGVGVIEMVGEGDGEVGAGIRVAAEVEVVVTVVAAGGGVEGTRGNEIGRKMGCKWIDEGIYYLI